MKHVLHESCISGVQIPRQEFAPFTAKRLLNPHQGGDQNGDLACFNLLNGANIEIGQLCQTFLSYRFGAPFATDISAQPLSLRVDFLAL